MTLPNISVLHGSDPAPAPDPATGNGAQLHLSGPVQVHVHLGQAVPSAGQHGSAGTPRSPILWAMAGLVLAGGGYLFGMRSTAAPVRTDPAIAAPSDMLPPAPLASLPIPSSKPAELPPGLQQQLARPPLVTPPPGGAPARGRNPFGLGN